MEASSLRAPTPSAPPPPDGAHRHLAAWIVALGSFLHTVLVLAPIVAALLVVTALLGGVVEDEQWRLGAGAAACIVVPWLLRWRLGALLRRFRRPLPVPSVGLFLAALNLAVVTLLAFGFADDVGRALRRHGDWFLGERNGAVARGLRVAIASAAGYLERFDPPPELAPIIIPPDPATIPLGPWRPDEKPPVAEPTILSWFHPLAGPRRALPWNASRRFGAPRPQPRPPECELGHCGVDLGSTTGEPVFAVGDGVIERIERDEARGANAGRFVRVGHREGTVVTRYIHLDSIRNDLKEGDRVRGGELIGRLGRTGVEHSGAHLHFALSLRNGGRGSDEKYVDPEPYLRRWQLPDASSLPSAVASR